MGEFFLAYWEKILLIPFTISEVFIPLSPLPKASIPTPSIHHTHTHSHSPSQFTKDNFFEYTIVSGSID